MSLAGNLRTMPLPEILQWISMSVKTGTLHLSRRSVQKRIIFQEGEIFSTWSNDPQESLGQFLIRDNRITEEQLFRALLRQEQEGRLLGSILVADGSISEADLTRTLTAKAEETVYDLFHWPEGQFEFKDGEFPAGFQFSIRIAVNAVLLEGIRRVDEWARIRRVFPTMQTSFRPGPAPGDVQDATERKVLDLVAAGKTLAEICLEIRRSDFVTAAILFDLCARDLVSVASTGDDQSPADPVGAISALLTRAYQKLQEKRYDSAARSYEEVLALDRLNQNAKKGLLAVMDARDRDRAANAVPLDKVPILIMGMAALTQERFDPNEGFVLSRVNGEWEVRSILKVCPMAEDETLRIFARLLERKVIALR
jgi:hypothetical protein